MTDFVVGTFILDFQTVNFEADSRIALEVLEKLQKDCQLENSFALDDPVARAGWSFAKLFFSGQFVERIYSRHGFEIDATKGKKMEDRFISWFGTQLLSKGCRAHVKMAPEMKSL